MKEKYAEAWIVENARRAVALAALHANLRIGLLPTLTARRASKA